MFLETVDQFAKTAVIKAEFLRRSPLGFTISSMMAGAYVGLGIILIFCVGNAVDPSIRPIVMGASFGIALTLVIFAGSDLFTGHTMFITHGWLQGRVSLRELGGCWGVSWAGNLLGCALLAGLFVAGGGGPALLSLGGKAPLIVNVAAAKMNAPAIALPIVTHSRFQPRPARDTVAGCSVKSAIDKSVMLATECSNPLAMKA